MRGSRRISATAALVAAAAVVTGVVVAQAARLDVDAGQVSTIDGGHPCPDAVEVTPTSGSGTSFTAVSVPVPAACAGRPVGVVLLNGTTVVASGTVTSATSPTTTVPVGVYTAAAGLAARVVVDGWVVDADWSFAPSGPAIRCWTTDTARPCTATVTVRNNHVWSWGYDLDIVVSDARTSPGNNGVAWTVELDFSNAAYPWVPNGVDGWSVLAGSTCADLPLLTLTGRPDHGNHELRRGTQVAFSIQPNNNGTGNLLACG